MTGTPQQGPAGRRRPRRPGPPSNPPGPDESPGLLLQRDVLEGAAGPFARSAPPASGETQRPTAVPLPATPRTMAHDLALPRVPSRIGPPARDGRPSGLPVAARAPGVPSTGPSRAGWPVVANWRRLPRPRPRQRAIAERQPAGAKRTRPLTTDRDGPPRSSPLTRPERRLPGARRLPRNAGRTSADGSRVGPRRTRAVAWPPAPERGPATRLCARRGREGDAGVAASWCPPRRRCGAAESE